jgi:hypothetical protein
VATLNTPYSDGVNLPVTISNVNTGGCLTQYRVKCRANAIYTLGKGESVARAAFISGTTGGQIIKTGPGKLERIVLAKSGGGGVATVEIGQILATADETAEIEYDVNFNNGLFVVISGSGTISTTITYD